MKAWWAAVAAVASLIVAGCDSATDTPTATPVGPTTASRGGNDPAPIGQASAIAQWRNRSAAAVASMQDAMRDLGIAMKSADYPAIQADCRKVSDAAKAIGSALPSPDSKLTAAFDGAVNSFTVATGSCGIWVPGVSHEQVNAFLSSMHQAIDQMDTAMYMASGAPQR
jgi:hypothetical protein